MKVNIMHVKVHTDDAGNMLTVKLKRRDQYRTYHPTPASRERLGAIINKYTPSQRHAIREGRNKYHFTLISGDARTVLPKKDNVCLRGS